MGLTWGGGGEDKNEYKWINYLKRYGEHLSRPPM